MDDDRSRWAYLFEHAGVALGHVTFAADSLLAAADYARPQPGTRTRGGVGGRP